MPGSFCIPHEITKRCFQCEINPTKKVTCFLIKSIPHKEPRGARQIQSDRLDDEKHAKKRSSITQLPSGSRPSEHLHKTLHRDPSIEATRRRVCASNGYAEAHLLFVTGGLTQPNESDHSYRSFTLVYRNVV